MTDSDASAEGDALDSLFTDEEYVARDVVVPRQGQSVAV